MKVTIDSRHLCSFLTNHKPDFAFVNDRYLSFPDLAMAYLCTSLDDAIIEGRAKELWVPEHSRSFATLINPVTRRVEVYQGIDSFTTLDRVVMTDVPTLVEARFTGSNSTLKSYFRKCVSKREAMSALYGDFAYILLLPMCFPNVSGVNRFENDGGKIAVVPFMFNEIKSACLSDYTGSQ